MKPQVFLKFNRPDVSAYLCLMSWLEIFRDYEITIICDCFSSKHPMPSFLSEYIDKEIKIENTDYAIGRSFLDRFPKKKSRNQGSANLTAFKLSMSDKFWIIDADDTMWLTRDFQLIKEKILEAEKYFDNSSLDGLSLDFYRELNDIWTFGMCLIKRDLDFSCFDKLDIESENKKHNTNIDICFDLMRKNNNWKLKSFIFDGLPFQHLINNFKDLPHGIYMWSNGKFDKFKLKKDIVIL